MPAKAERLILGLQAQHWHVIWHRPRPAPEPPVSFWNEVSSEVPAANCQLQRTCRDVFGDNLLDVVKCGPGRNVHLDIVGEGHVRQQDDHGRGGERLRVDRHAGAERVPYPMLAVSGEQLQTL